MSKAKSKILQRRTQRRVLNKALDFFSKISGRRLAHHGHGSGLGRDAIEQHLIDRNRQDTYRRAGFPE